MRHHYHNWATPRPASRYRLRLARVREWGTRTRTWSVRDVADGAPIVEHYRGPLVCAAVVWCVLRLCARRSQQG